MNLNDNATIDELRQMIRDCDDAAGVHVMWVDKKGEVFITLMKDKTPAQWATEMESKIQFRFESMGASNDYVGKHASEDNEYISNVFRNLTNHWKDGSVGYIDY